MYCSHCGREISVEDQYCPGCGAWQETEVVSAEEVYAVERSREEQRRRANRRGRRLGNFLVSVIALLILFFGNEKVPDVSDYIGRRMTPSCFTVQNPREMAICDPGGEVCTVDIPKEMLSSGDQSRMAYVDRDGELYAVEELSPVYIDDQVKAARLSFYGHTLAYVRTTESGGEEFCIRDLETQDCERQSIAGCRGFRVSPDGTRAACVEADGMLSLRGAGLQKEIAGKVSEVLALSEGGERILYRKDSGQLFLYARGREKKVSQGAGTIAYLLNEEQTEILYTEDKATWYLSAETEEPVRLSGVKGTVLTSCYMGDTAYQQEQDGLILGRKTLKDMTFATSDPADRSYKIYRLDRNGERAETIINHAEQFQISRNGWSVLCLADQKLYQIRDIRISLDKSCLSGDLEVRQFAADPELQKIWFVTQAPELYYIKKKECVPVSYEASQLHGFCADGVLFREGQDLYYTEEDEKILVKTDVENVWIKGDQYAVVDTDRELCYLKDLKDEVALLSSR